MYQTDILDLIKQLGDLRFEEGRVTAQLESHIRMLGVISEVSPEETSTPPIGSPVIQGTLTDQIIKAVEAAGTLSVGEIGAAVGASRKQTDNTIPGIVSRLTNAGVLHRPHPGKYSRGPVPIVYAGTRRHPPTPTNGHGAPNDTAETVD